MLRRCPRLAGAVLARRMSTTAEYAVAPYRQMVNATAEQRTIWAAADVTLHARMRDHVPAALQHNGEEEFDQRTRNAASACAIYFFSHAVLSASRLLCAQTSSASSQSFARGACPTT